MGRVYKSPCGNIELREGRWQDVLCDVERVDAVITDPPYSERTHKGALDATTLEVGVNGYAFLSTVDVRKLVHRWCLACSGWVVIHTDDQLHPIMRDAMANCERYTFPMFPVLQQQPRVSGDGPSSCGHFLAISRPSEKRFLSWGSLPGWYECQRDGKYIRGGKPINLMRAIVRDYSRLGDLICDPYAGGATTLLAAAIEGRRAIGSEMDPNTFDLAVERLKKGYTPKLF
jgi:site-specific DNA-methyltransferase (adenine-specific)